MAEPLRVLLVEDSADDALLLEREIRRGGFDLSLTQVESEAQFLAAVSQAWDVVIADYVLPRLTALGVLRHLRHLRLDVPTIVISGTVTESELVEAMRAGARDYIQKENLSRLVVAIRRELDEAAGRRRRREAEDALREAQERFRFVVENTGDVVYRLRFPDMVYDYVSPGIERLTGYGPREINGVGLNGLVVSMTDPAGAPISPEKAEWARPGLRRLFLSGYTEGVVADKGLIAEGAHFLQKPFTTEALEAKVRDVLDAPARTAR